MNTFNNNTQFIDYTYPFEYQQYNPNYQPDYNEYQFYDAPEADLSLASVFKIALPVIMYGLGKLAKHLLSEENPEISKSSTSKIICKLVDNELPYEKYVDKFIGNLI